MKEGMFSRVTTGGLGVIRLHYAADDEKDPSTPDGAEWLRKQLQGYPGGLRNHDWLREMEIEYSAGGGDRVFPFWADWQRESQIFIDPEPDISNATLYGSYDHGFVNAACYLVHAVYPASPAHPKGLKRTIWEFYANKVAISFIARIILGEESVMLPDGRIFDGNPYAGKEIIKIADPEIDRRTQSNATGDNKRVIELFAAEGVHFNKGERGDDLTVVNYLIGTLFAKPNDPSYQITRNCRYLIWELGKLERAKLSAQMSAKVNQKEGLVDKDNHGWDALKYFLKTFPYKTEKPEEQVTSPNSFSWWMSQTNKAPKTTRYARRGFNGQKKTQQSFLVSKPPTAVGN